MSDAGTVKWKELGGRRCLVVTFPPHLTREIAEGLASEMSRRIESSASEVTLVWDATRMKGYDREARELWQETLKTLRGSLGRIHLVTESSAIRLGAAAISLFTGYDIKSTTSLDRLDFGDGGAG